MKEGQVPGETLIHEGNIKTVTAAGRLKRYLRVLFFASLGLIILWLITRNQDIEKIWSELGQVSYFWIVLSIFAGILSHIARAIRWNILIRPLGNTPKTTITFYALMTGYLANLAVPRLGEITRTATLARYSRHPFNSLAGTVVAERVFDMICILSLIFLTVVFQFSYLRSFLGYYIYNPVLNLVEENIILLLFLAMGFLLFAGFLVKYFYGVNRQNTDFSGKLKRQLIGFWKGMISLAYVRQKALFFGLSAFIWTMYFMTVYLVFFALPGTSALGVSAGFTILALGTLGVVAPVPGGLGTYHFIVITTLTELMGISLESATSYAYVAHAAQIFVALMLGGFAWLMLSFMAKQK